MKKVGKVKLVKSGNAQKVYMENIAIKFANA